MAIAETSLSPNNWVKIGDNVKIYPGVFIGDNVSIGDNTVIFSGAKIYSETVIGNFCVLNSSRINMVPMAITLQIYLRKPKLSSN